MKALLLTNNSTASAVAAGGAVPLGTAVHGFCNAIKLNGNAITLTATGYYEVLVNITAAVTAATALTATIYSNGSTTQASASATPAAAGGVVNLTIPWVIRKGCAADSTSLTVVLDSAATVNNVTVEVTKE